MATPMARAAEPAGKATEPKGQAAAVGPVVMVATRVLVVLSVAMPTQTAVVPAP